MVERLDNSYPDNAAGSCSLLNVWNYSVFDNIEKLPLSRRKSRELAAQILFQIDFTRQPAEEALPLFAGQFRSHEDLGDFTTRLVRGVDEYRKDIDHRIEKYSEHWSLERISRVDCNILRMAIFEILWCPDIPPKVSINEAIELGKKYGTEKSGSFINGILDKISHTEER